MNKMDNMQATESQAFKIYFIIYQDHLNKNTGLYEVSQSQIKMREALEKANGWSENENKNHLVDKIINKLIFAQASYVMGLLEDCKWQKAQDILTQ